MKKVIVYQKKVGSFILMGHWLVIGRKWGMLADFSVGWGWSDA